MPLQKYNEQWTYTEMANIEMKKETKTFLRDKWYSRQLHQPNYIFKMSLSIEIVHQPNYSLKISRAVEILENKL